MAPELDIIRAKKIIETALKEDIGPGDITTDSVVPVSVEASAVITAKESGIAAGLPVAEEVFHSVDKMLSVEKMAEDGDKIFGGREIMKISGMARSILYAERTALNFLSRLSGIATLAGRFTEMVRGTGAVILDTRKTTPGMRCLEKYASAAGGAQNHREGLFDRILIKDNHLKVQKELGPGYIHRAVKMAKKRSGSPVEVEVASREEAEDAADAGADILLLDNMPAEDISRIAERFAGRIVLEVSGRVTMENVREIARTGIDYISIGAITHSAPALDFSLNIL